ncbi:polymorphic toxin-type HINT domain-containing protein [Hymenobacter terrenus]|uniref:polymorphic toxin-type HINT domain-containing protein n=1 Tax=Hymenobacter terrenus TaxID=1629124 RepID=UPI000619C215|nr:polymorphic toxin-type HINT domain-containing protein [Hymenobacter terrenus]
MSDSLEYIVSGALMTCSEGLVPAAFTATPRKTKISGKVAGNELDRGSIKNVPSFIICKKLTQQAGGNPVPCVPAPQPWQKTYPAKVGGAKALVMMSCLRCSAGQGLVEFLSSGQIPLSAQMLMDLQAERKQGMEALLQADRERKSVGEAGLLESLVPIWGSGRDLAHSVQTLKPGEAVVNGGFLIWDIVSVAAGVVSFGSATAAGMAGKAGVRAAMGAGKKVVIGAAKKKLTTLMARSVAIKTSFRKGLATIRKEAAGLTVRACFPAGTPVHTRLGNQPIESLKIGDEVWAYDEDTEQTAWKKVLQTHQTQSLALVEIAVVGDVVQATPTHAFFVNNAWKAAQDLQPGDLLSRADGAVTAVLQVTLQAATSPVYNLEVADYHTYFVGSTGLLVHNECNALNVGGVLKKPLKPNHTYVRNGVKFRTDASGRIIDATRVGATSGVAKVIRYKGFGGNIRTRAGVTTTVIGKFDDPIKKGMGTQVILQLPEGSFTRIGKNPGGINILDIPGDKYQKLLDTYGPTLGQEKFWQGYNKPFLENAFKGGHDIRLLSDPVAARTGFYARELREIEGYVDKAGKSVPGLARRYGYRYNPATSSFEKIISR